MGIPDKVRQTCLLFEQKGREVTMGRSVCEVLQKFTVTTLYNNHATSESLSDQNEIRDDSRERPAPFRGIKTLYLW